MLSRMSAEEFEYWKAYAEIEPFGEWRKDFRAGINTSSIINLIQQHIFETFTPAKASDFVLKIKDFEEIEKEAPDPAAAWKAVKAGFKGIAEAYKAEQNLLKKRAMNAQAALDNAARIQEEQRNGRR